MVQIYSPSDDSYFFAEFLRNYLSGVEGEINYLDMGAGSGILSEVALGSLKKENIFSADINLEAINLLRSKGFKEIHTDLFSNINQNFDLITFNAPYLPKDNREPEDSQVSTTGGINGDEISLNFLKQAKEHLNKNGKIFLLISSLTPQENLKKFNPREVARKRIFMEDLIILEFE